jgi:hypothetical protein
MQRLMAGSRPDVSTVRHAIDQVVLLDGSDSAALPHLPVFALIPPPHVGRLWVWLAANPRSASAACSGVQSLEASTRSLMAILGRAALIPGGNRQHHRRIAERQRIIIHRGTGDRAKMADHTLEDAGKEAGLLNAEIGIEENRNTGRRAPRGPCLRLCPLAALERFALQAEEKQSAPEQCEGDRARERPSE